MSKSKEKFVLNVTTEKQFKKSLANIVTCGDSLARHITDSGLFAIAQANLHGNVTAGIMLLEAMGKKHDKARVIIWLVNFGKFAYSKDKGLTYRNRKDILPENVDSWIIGASETPYYEFSKQAEPEFKVDVYKALASLIARPAKVEKAADEKGKEFTLLHGDMIGALQEVLAQFTPVTPAPTHTK